MTRKQTPPDERVPLTPVTFQVLLSLLGGAMHGYGIKRDVEERTDGTVRLGAGTLYARLQRMEEEGLIRETETPDDLEEDASSRWRFYDVTPLGRRTLEAEVRRLESDVEAARTMLASVGGGPG